MVTASGCGRRGDIGDKIKIHQATKQRVATEREGDVGENNNTERGNTDEEKEEEEKEKGVWSIFYSKKDDLVAVHSDDETSWLS
jgi:hypothetical protein